jgi:PH domain
MQDVIDPLALFGEAPIPLPPGLHSATDKEVPNCENQVTTKKKKEKESEEEEEEEEESSASDEETDDEWTEYTYDVDDDDEDDDDDDYLQHVLDDGALARHELPSVLSCFDKVDIRPSKFKQMHSTYALELSMHAELANDVSARSDWWAERAKQLNALVVYCDELADELAEEAALNHASAAHGSDDGVLDADNDTDGDALSSGSGKRRRRRGKRRLKISVPKMAKRRARRQESRKLANESARRRANCWHVVTTANTQISSVRLVLNSFLESAGSVDADQLQQQQQQQAFDDVLEMEPRAYTLALLSSLVGATAAADADGTHMSKCVEQMAGECAQLERIWSMAADRTKMLVSLAKKLSAEVCRMRKQLESVDWSLKERRVRPRMVVALELQLVADAARLQRTLQISVEWAQQLKELTAQLVECRHRACSRAKELDVCVPQQQSDSAATSGGEATDAWSRLSAPSALAGANSSSDDDSDDVADDGTTRGIDTLVMDAKPAQAGNGGVDVLATSAALASGVPLPSSLRSPRGGTDGKRKRAKRRRATTDLDTQKSRGDSGLPPTATHSHLEVPARAAPLSSTSPPVVGELRAAENRAASSSSSSSIGNDGGDVLPALSPRHMRKQSLVSSAHVPLEHRDAATALVGDPRASMVSTHVKSGWMRKKGEVVKNWKRRFFVLDFGGDLQYFLDESQQRRKGVIHVPLATDIGRLPDVKRYGFYLAMPSRTYYFDCASQHTMTDWISVLKTARKRKE